MVTRRLVILLGLCAVSCRGSQPSAPSAPASAPAVRPPAPASERQELPLDPSIRHGVLPNGMTYYVKTQRRPEKRAQLWLAINAGSVLETDQQRGLAHMLEHLAFEGTRRFPGHEIQDFMERSGMKFGADLNAYTGFDETVYQLVVPTDDPATVARGLDVLRDWSSDITFDPKEVVDERRIIEEERRFRNSAAFRMLTQIIPVAYEGSRYARRLPIGTPETIAAATVDSLVAFYRSWYRPDLMAVIVVGDIDAAAIEHEIRARFSDIPSAAPDAPERAAIPVDMEHAPRMVVARDRENAIYTVDIEYRLPRRPRRTAADLRRTLVEAVFGRLLSDRLAVISRREQSAWTSAYAQFGPDVRPADKLALSAAAKGGKIEETVADLTLEMARVRQHGFSREEIAGAVAAIRQLFEEGLREAETRESYDIAEEIVRHFMEREAMPGPAVALELAKRYLPTITSDELVAIARAVGDRGRVVVVRAPMKGKVPSEKEIAEKMAAAAGRSVEPWQALDLSRPLLAAEPEPGKVTGEKRLAQGVTEWTLSNGARVLLKPTAFKKDEVTVTAVSTGGTSAVSNAAYPQARSAAEIANAGGFGNYSVDELQKKLAGKKVGVRAAIDDDEERIEGISSAADLETMMQLMHAAFVAPRRDEAAFAAWKTRQLQFVEQLEATSQARLVIGAFDFLFSGHPRVPLPFPERKGIEAIRFDAALAQYRARMADAADFSFVVVGAFDPARLRPLVERYLASLPSTPERKRETVRDVGLRVRKGVTARTVRAGTEAKSMSLLIAWSPAKWTYEVEADAWILQHVLDMELLAQLREKLGGTYGVSVQTDAGRKAPQQATTVVVFESAPERVKAMQDEAWKTIERISNSPLSDDLLARVRQQIKRAHDTRLTENQFWTEALVRLGRYGDDLDRLVAVDRVIARVTREQVQKTARLFLSKANRSTFTLLPEAPATKSP
jgi:zinc protease